MIEVILQQLSHIILTQKTNKENDQNKIYQKENCKH